MPGQRVFAPPRESNDLSKPQSHCPRRTIFRFPTAPVWCQRLHMSSLR